MKRTTLKHGTLGIALGLSTVTAAAVEGECPDTIHNTYRCAQFLENDLAKRHPRLFSRAGSQLVIRLKNGETRTYVDFPDEAHHGAGGRWYSLAGYYPEIGYALVAVQYYEGDTYYLISVTTGKEENIASAPVISPDRKRIAVANVGLPSGYTPNALSVFKLRPGGLIKEFFEAPDDWGPGDLRWVSNEEITFTQYRVNPDYSAADDLVGAPRKLIYRPGKWHIE